MEKTALDLKKLTEGRFELIRADKDTFVVKVEGAVFQLLRGEGGDSWSFYVQTPQTADPTITVHIDDPSFSILEVIECDGQFDVTRYKNQNI